MKFTFDLASLCFFCFCSLYNSYIVQNKHSLLQSFIKESRRILPLGLYTNIDVHPIHWKSVKKTPNRHFVHYGEEGKHINRSIQEQKNDEEEEGNEYKKMKKINKNDLTKKRKKKKNRFNVIRKLPLVAIIGRPNVGKSTIFNRLTRKFQEGNIVLDICSTRDRIYGEADWDGCKFELVDTGGLILEDKEEHKFSKDIKTQILFALNESALVLFIVDGLQGVHPGDLEICKFLRNYIQKKKKETLKEKCGHNNNDLQEKEEEDEEEQEEQEEKRDDILKVILCVNKCESYKDGYLKAQEFWQLGYGTPFPCSGIHGNGLAEILDEVLKHIEKIHIDEQDEENEQEHTINVSFIGKPNTGKSSILNKILRSDRFIVSPIAGTTVDSIDVFLRVSMGEKSIEEETDERAGSHIGEQTETQEQAQALLHIGEQTETQEQAQAQEQALLHIGEQTETQEQAQTKEVVESRKKISEEAGERIYRLIDTAGIQKRKKNIPFNEKTKFEYLLFNRTEKAIKRSDVCILVIDSFSGISSHDINIARTILKHNKSCIICCNKWDLIHNKNNIFEETKNYVRNILKPIDFCDILFVSAKTSQRLVHIFQHVEEAYKNFTKKVNTNTLNQIIKEALLLRPPIPIKNKSLKIYYAFQAHVKPPGFVFFCNSEKSVYSNYTKYLESRIRESFQIKNTPIKIYYRQKKLRQVMKKSKQPDKYNLDIKAIQAKFLKMQSSNDSAS